MAIAKYSIEAKSLTKTKTLVKAREFEFIIDEPQAVGGENAGATPVEYVLGALAGCLNVVCNLVAKEMGITVNNLSFNFEGDLDPDKFMGKQTEKRSGFQVIRAKITADVDADAETKQKWLDAVKQRCPVSDNLSNVTPVEIILA